MENETIPFDRESVKKYLDDCIRYWREERENGNPDAIFYVDAFQTVRISIFGELSK